MSAIEQEKKQKELKKLTVLILFAAYCQIGYSLLAPLYPFEAAERDLSSSMIGLIFAVFGVSNFLFTVLSPTLDQIFGRKKLLVTGLILEGICTSCFGLISLVPNRLLFIIFSFVIRFSQGIGSALIQTLLYSIVTSISTKKNMERNVGYIELGDSVGVAVGPLLASFCYHLFGFIVPFLLAGSIEITGIFLVSVLELNKKIKDEDEEAKKLLKPDHKGNNPLFDDESVSSRSSRVSIKVSPSEKGNISNNDIIITENKEENKIESESGNATDNETKDISIKEEESKKEEDNTEKGKEEIKNNEAVQNKKEEEPQKEIKADNNNEEDDEDEEEENPRVNIIQVLFGNIFVFLIFCSILLDTTSLSVTYPVFSVYLFENYEISEEVTSLFFVIQTVGYFCAIQIIGPINRRLTNKISMIMGLILNGFFILFLPPIFILPHKIGVIIAGLFGLGLAGACINIPSVIENIELIQNKFRLKKSTAEDYSSSIFNMGFFLGETCGPLIGGFLTDHFGFQNCCIFVSCANLLFGLVFSYFILYNTKSQDRDKYIGDDDSTYNNLLSSFH